MDINSIQGFAASGLDLSVKAADTVNQINQMIIDRNQEIDKKLINLNAEQKIEDLKKEGIGQNLDVLA
jgi:tellurite resistance protein